MVQEHLYAEMAGRMLRQRWIGAPRRPISVSGPRLVRVVEHALVERRRKRRLLQRIRWAVAGGGLGVAVVFAALLLVGPNGRALSSGRAPLQAAGTQEVARLPPRSRALSVVDTGVPLAPGVRLAAHARRPLEVRSPGGTALTVEPGGSLLVVDVGAVKRFALLVGAVSARVEKLSPGEGFVVETADAQIEVHGTRFRVSVGGDPAGACGAAPVTRVTVSEGVVAVRSGGREIRLVSGDEWRTTCAVTKRPLAPAAPRRPPAAPSEVALPVENDAAGSPPERPVSAAAVEAGGAHRGDASERTSLEAQNELFSGAMRAKRSGRVGDALDMLGQFIDDYPESPLLESALVQRMRLAAVDDPAWATGVAMQYLTRFRDGFARAEAQEIAGVVTPR